MEQHPVTLNNKLTLAEAAREVDVSPTCVFRWVDRGLGGVKLAHIRLGRRLYTSVPALEQFGRDVAEARQSESVTV